MSDELDLEKDDDLDLGLDDFGLDGDTELNIPADAAAAEEPLSTEGMDLEVPAEVAAEPAAETPPSVGEQAVGLTADVPVQLVAVLGKKRITMHELLQLQQGQTFDLGTPVTHMVDLVANGKLVAKGELVDIDGQLGVRLTKLLK